MKFDSISGTDLHFLHITHLVMRITECRCPVLGSCSDATQMNKTSSHSCNSLINELNIQYAKQIRNEQYSDEKATFRNRTYIT